MWGWLACVLASLLLCNRGVVGLLDSACVSDALRATLKYV